MLTLLRDLEELPGLGRFGASLGEPRGAGNRLLISKVSRGGNEDLVFCPDSLELCVLFVSFFSLFCPDSIKPMDVDGSKGDEPIGTHMFLRESILGPLTETAR